LIKANIPTRISFAVASVTDSRVILDSPGAEKLLGRGDMLYMPPDLAKPVRIQGCFVSDKELNALIDFLKTQKTTEYNDQILNQPVSGGHSAKNSPATSGAIEDKDPIELIDLNHKKTICVVGAFQSYINKIAATQNNLFVLELNENAFEENQKQFYESEVLG
jgi:DNA segregation ATPase FtsK/SpoIIIE-like protein